MTKILFICTGNVFRSMIAEKCLKSYILKNDIKDIKVDSAGIGTKLQKPEQATLERLNFHGIKTLNHQYKQINQKLIDNSDLIISINTPHQKYLKENFKIDTPLFNEVAFGRKEGILDFWQFDSSISTFKKARKKDEKEKIQKYAYYVVDYIHDAIPSLIKNINKWL